jgi:hypothetical protein
MIERGFDKTNKASTIDLLLNLDTTQKWRPYFIRKQNYWKILSGNWIFDSNNKTICLAEPQIKPAENISIIGPSSWNKLTFNVNFKILSNSIKPPEGGTILYFKFKNIKNFYSFHFCLYKKKIEFIKRHHGIWTTIAQQDFDFEILKDYSVTISSSSGIHQCQVDGKHLIEAHDKKIEKGCAGIGAKYCGIQFSHVSALIA